MKKWYKRDSATSGVAVMTQEKAYFMRRAAQERSAANRATDAKAKQAHAAMARRYKELVNAANEPPQAAA